MITDLTVFSNAVMLSQKAIEDIKSIIITEVKDEDSYIKAGDLLAETKLAIKLVDGRREELKAPYLEEGKLIDGKFMPMIKTLKELQGKIDNGLQSWARKEHERKEAAIKAAREKEQAEMEAEKNRLAQIAADNEKSDPLASTMAMGMAESIEDYQAEKAAQPVKAVVRTTGGMGKMSSTEDWQFTVEVPSAVPREFCEPVDKLIRAAVKSGVREISGVKIYNKMKFTNR